MSATFDFSEITTEGPPWSSESRKDTPAPSFTALFADDLSSRTLNSAYPGWNSKSIVVDDAPGGVGRAIRCSLDANTPPTCGGDHFFGGRSTLPQSVPIGNRIWYSVKLYHPSTQTWGYSYANADFEEAQGCSKEADGNAWLKHLVLAPTTGTARIYVQPAVSRRSVAATPGMRIISETGPTYNDEPAVQLPQDQWFALQVEVLVSNGVDGRIRVWIDDTLVNEVIGPNVSAGNSLNEIGMGDYWNGNPFTDGGVGRLSFWLREIIVASDMAGYESPTGTDSLGNVFIDPSTTAAELS